MEAPLTGLQLRKGRALLGWTQEKLALKAGVHLQAVVRVESADGEPVTALKNLIALREALASAGIVERGDSELRLEAKRKKTAVMSLRISPVLKASIERAVREDGRSLTSLIEALLKEYLNSRDGPHHGK